MLKGPLTPMATNDITCSFKDSALGLDYYWPGTSIREACERFDLRPDQVVKMASNECAYGPSPRAIEAAAAALATSSIYPSSKYDYSALTRAFAGYAGVDASMIAPAPGSETMVRYLTLVFLGHDTEVVVSSQSYDGHQIASCIAGATVRSVPPVDYRYDVDGLIAAVNERTRIIWVCNPDNPSGTALTAAEARRLIAAVPPSVAVVFDEAYHEFVDDPDYGDGQDLLLAGHRNVVVLRTLSKAFGLAALRLGYAIADPELCTIVDNIREPFYIAGPSCAAGIAAVTEDVEWSRRVCAETVSERARVQAALAGLGLGVVPSQANFVLVDTGKDGTGLYERLMRHGIIVRLGSIWGYDTHVRITIGTPEQNDRLLAAVAAEI
jgi:histidinol-phosphate aminotransferase